MIHDGSVLDAVKLLNMDIFMPLRLMLNVPLLMSLLVRDLSKSILCIFCPGEDSECQFLYCLALFPKEVASKWRTHIFKAAVVSNTYITSLKLFNRFEIIMRQVNCQGDRRPCFHVIVYILLKKS